VVKEFLPKLVQKAAAVGQTGEFVGAAQFFKFVL